MRPLPLCLALLAASAARGGPLIVALDPGHGGAYPRDGAHGRGGLVEKQVALAVAEKLKVVLEEAGATVVLTREDDNDVSLAQRAQLANEASADLFLSIHCNSMGSPSDRRVTRGVETYFLSPDPTDQEAKLLAELENGGPDAAPLPKAADPVSGILADLALTQARNDSARLAQIVHRHMVRDARIPNRGVRQAPFVVLWGTRMPSVLVEVGFISHPVEGRLLGQDRHQQRIAEALAAAVQEYAETVLERRLLAAQSPRAMVVPEIRLTGRRPPAPPVAAAAAAR